MNNLLTETTNAWGMTLSARQIDQFATYADELRRWNERVNLTAITDPEGIVVRHFLDSLSCALVWGRAPRSLIDIGTGAGFPGLPLKILRPELELTLVESVAKKTAFLSHMIALLDLDQVAVLPLRAEQVGRDRQHRERYDVAVARAVADLRVLAEYCLPLCRVSGRFLAPKSQDVQHEADGSVPAITTLGGRMLEIRPIVLPNLEPRAIVVVEKIATTPANYPRANGVPARKPLV